MAHKASYELTLVNIDNELVIINTAVWKNHRLDIYKYNFTQNKYFVRWGNVNCSSIGGWLVEFPNEKFNYRYYGGKYVAKEHPFEECQQLEGLEWGSFLYSPEKIKRIILEVHPEYKYLINKVNFDSVRYNIWKLLKCMRMWKDHPSEVEALVSIDYYNLACNKNLYRLSKPKKKQVIQALKQFNVEQRNSVEPSLMTIQQYIKSGLNFQEWYSYMCWNNWRVKDADSVETFRYCQRKNIDKYRYHDMLAMAHKQGHNIDDPYWKYPNDPNKMHDELLEVKKELARIEHEKELEREKQYWNQLVKIAKRNKLQDGIDLGNGYTLFMPTTYEQYNAAATMLHQCILASQYYIKVAKGKSLLFMIWKDGNPSSTCELDFNKKILQFYGNELDRENCKPSEMEQEMMNNFLLTFKPKKLEFKEARA